MKEEVSFLEKESKGYPLKLYVNGICLDDAIDGFNTLNVFGRTVAHKKVNITEGTDNGGFMSSNRYKTRKLTVEYWIKAKDNKALIKGFEKLNKILEGDNLDIVVNDEKFHYFGVVSEFGEINDTTNWIYSKFDIVCLDPFKYSDIYSIKFDRVTNFPYLFLHETIPDSIEVDLKGDCDIVKITNTTNGKSIILNGRFKNGDNILVDIKNSTVVYNRRNNLNMLNLLSDFEDFTINFDDEIVVVGSSSDSCTIKFRERRL